MSLFLLLNTKEDVLKNDWNIYFHSIFFFFYYGSQWCLTTLVLYNNIFLCVHQKKETPTDLENLEGE